MYINGGTGSYFNIPLNDNYPEEEYIKISSDASKPFLIRTTLFPDHHTDGTQIYASRSGFTIESETPHDQKSELRDTGVFVTFGNSSAFLTAPEGVIISAPSLDYVVRSVLNSYQLIFYDNSIYGGYGAELVKLSNDGLALRDANRTLRVNLSKTGIAFNDTSGTELVKLSNDGLALRDANGTLRVNLSKTGIAFNDTSGTVLVSIKPYASYGKHALIIRDSSGGVFAKLGPSYFTGEAELQLGGTTLSESQLQRLLALI